MQLEIYFLKCHTSDKISFKISSVALMVFPMARSRKDPYLPTEKISAIQGGEKRNVLKSLKGRG